VALQGVIAAGVKVERCGNQERHEAGKEEAAEKKGHGQRTLIQHRATTGKQQR
jgi:hypothetical protein